MASCLYINLFSCMPSLAWYNHQNGIEDAKYINLKAQTASWGKKSQSLPSQYAAPNAAFPSSPPPPPLLLRQYKTPHVLKKMLKKGKTDHATMSHAVYPNKNQVFLIEQLFPSRPPDEWNRKTADPQLSSICHTGGTKSETNTNSWRCCITWGLLSHFFSLY